MSRSPTRTGLSARMRSGSPAASAASSTDPRSAPDLSSLPVDVRRDRTWPSEQVTLKVFAADGQERVAFFARLDPFADHHRAQIARGFGDGTDDPRAGGRLLHAAHE